MVSEKTTFRLSTFFALTLTLVLIFSITSVSAAMFSADYRVIKATITPDEIAEYNVTITNYDNVERVYSLSLSPGDSVQWISSPSSILVPADSSRSFVMRIYPQQTVGFGTYQVSIRVQANDGSTQNLGLPVSLSLNAFYFGYYPDIAVNVVSPKSQDPREKMKVEILMRNRNQLDIKNLVVEISSELFYKSFNMSLAPMKEVTNDVLFDLNPLQTPGEYSFKVKLYYPPTDQIVTEVNKQFEIAGYSTVNIERKESKNLFLTEETIILENIGNNFAVKEVNVKAPWISRIFISTEPDAEVVDIDGDVHLQWAPRLAPNQIMELKLYRNYRPLVIILVLVVIALVLYYLLRSPVLVLKEAAVIGEDEEGISEIKVRVFIKNRSRKPVHSISISDRIPRITDLVETPQLGGMKPTRITKNTKRGTIIFWDIDRLDSFEERILTYRLKSQLKIVGDMTMPRVRVKFESSMGRERTVVSSVPLFLRK